MLLKMSWLARLGVKQSWPSQSVNFLGQGMWLFQCHDPEPVLFELPFVIADGLLDAPEFTLSHRIRMRHEQKEARQP